MQKNSFGGYFSVVGVKTPVPNEKGKFNVTATLISQVGSIFNTETNKYEQEVREVDVLFVDLSEKHLRIIAPNSEIFINGGNVISYRSPWSYDSNKFQELLNDKDPSSPKTNREHMIQKIMNSLKVTLPDDNHEDIQRELNIAIQFDRRVTIVRCKPSDWSLQANPAQVSAGVKVESLED